MKCLSCDYYCCFVHRHPVFFMLIKQSLVKTILKINAIELQLMHILGHKDDSNEQLCSLYEVAKIFSKISKKISIFILRYCAFQQHQFHHSTCDFCVVQVVEVVQLDNFIEKAEVMLSNKLFEHGISYEIF